MKSCCLVSRTWAHYIHRRLFCYVKLDSPTQRESLITAMQGASWSNLDSRGRHVDTLDFTGDSEAQTYGEVLDMLFICPRLVSLRVACGISPNAMHDLELPTVRLQLLTKLFIFNDVGRSFDWHAVFHLLGLLHSLRFLSIIDHNYGEWVHTSDMECPVFRLKEFIFDCPHRKLQHRWVPSLLRNSMSNLEIIALNSQGWSESLLELLIAAAAPNLRSFGVDTCEVVSLDGGVIQACLRLEQFVVTGYPKGILPFLPCTVRSLQNGLPDKAAPLIGRPTESLQPVIDAIRRLPHLRILFIDG